MIPIFIITCNRLEALKESIQSYYDYIKADFEIVIVDFGSTYEPTLKYLKDLEYVNIKVYWKKRIRAPKGLNTINEDIQDYFMTHPTSNYVVTDPDIALDSVDSDILDVYSYLLKAIPKISVVGPMLRIDDIPDHYRNKEKVQATHQEYFWSKEIHGIKYKNKIIKYIFTKIDSTFGMRKAGTFWKRYKSGIRIMPPYSARHLDWYLDLDNPTSDHAYYMKYASRQIAHWSLWK